MNGLDAPNGSRDRRGAEALFDVLVRAALVFALALLCYRVFAPFLVLMAWAVILAITLYPLHRALARRIGGRQGWAAILITLAAVVVIIAPTAVLLVSVGDSVHHLVDAVRNNTLHVPPPPPSVALWPLVGPRIHGVWGQAATDLPALVQSLQPKIGELAKAALAMVASIGGSILMLVAAFIVAGILMAFGAEGARASLAVFSRVVGPERGAAFTALSAATIRAVAQGVVGIAFIQALAVGVCLVAAGIRLAGVLAGVVLVLGIAQVPALLVTLPVIAYLWMSGSYGTAEAAVLSVLLFVAGMADNVLKPLMLGRGVDAPMPVILLGALGGMATAGILGLFVGATLLALGYQIFTGWVATEPRAPEPSAPDSEATRVD